MLGSGVWALPDLPALRPVMERVAGLADRAEGDLLRLRASGWSGADEQTLQARYAGQRREEWVEFGAECAKFLVEIAKEHARAKYTLAELEEEEQSLDRLRRWYRDLRNRDLLGSGGAPEAEGALKDCVVAFEEYAERVYQVVAAPGADSTR